MYGEGCAEVHGEWVEGITIVRRKIEAVISIDRNSIQVPRVWTRSSSLNISID